MSVKMVLNPVSATADRLERWLLPIGTNNPTNLCCTGEG
ncbi:hypothetical protein AVDCRST_MAG81-4436 [uncultured Synechococcales cyanobacterium]|uniref:Uncharacterized protein n=1 Tax=uncultured Synechococcales cyanobacterium TaxID=1936017 RepID=A0A6J4VTA9_9CYAN|nr:hypothetical protein AVDCRST_MAG81-4436 [uncultured Synechococcales cyanobacterium]